ncbi:MAG: hypothetical protein CFE24_13595 [Flavobacterium sp. BFFFF2]|nr:MAG: hypothetical protein CFE24_13595 [Flavobacterium sp. BFFFF2]
MLLCVFSLGIQAQKVSSKADTLRIKIGAECKYTLQAQVKKGDRVLFPKAKSFGALEVIKTYPIDTVANEQQWTLTQKYGLIQFDSGHYTLPKAKILINKKPFYTDSIQIEVRDVVVDTLKQKMFDIKPILPAERSWDWLYYLLGCLLLGAVGFFAYRFYKNRNLQPKQEAIVYATPIEKATAQLQALEQKSLWQRGQIKDYYSELTDIARTYIEEEIHIPAKESTTRELIANLKSTVKTKKFSLSAETLQNLEQVLMQADLVKFAKSIPTEAEIESDKKRISHSIVHLHQAIPAEVETDDELEAWNEAQKEQQRLEQLRLRKKERMRRVAYGVLASCLVLFGISCYIFGFNTVKDNLLGHPTKSLLEGEWIVSDYGNPSVKIETPGVLTRVNPEKYLPKGSDALFKEMQLFALNDAGESDYNILVHTFKYKQETAVDLDQTVDSTIKNLELLGYQDILVKTEGFDTQKGISGKKAYGTMTKINSLTKSSTKLFYELLLFKQDGGLQEILLMHEEGDTYADRVTDRILKSVELQTPEN